MADSCDTFVVLSNSTKTGSIIFGKNSDRPRNEVQEVIFKESATHPDGSRVQCTYIEIPEAKQTYAVILSKPAWMWGAEMGANEHGVCIGNEAVFTKAQCPEDAEEKLLGMDMVRLALERCMNAEEAVKLIGQLLSTYGQGGRCFEDPDQADIIYHNSFIIADAKEAWVLETAGKHWAAEKVESGYRNISNQLSIATKIDLKSEGLEEFAKQSNLWDGQTPFDFAKTFAKPGPWEPGHVESAENRFKCGTKMLETATSEKSFGARDMFSILRSKESGICRTGLSPSGSTTTGSQVSVIPPPSSGQPAVHWLTATPNPAASVFKPFIFVEGIVPSLHVVSPDYGANDPVKVKPRFASTVDRRHALYKSQEVIQPLPGDEVNLKVYSQLQEIEDLCVQDVESFVASYDPSRKQELVDLFKDSVESEMKFYRLL